MLHHECPDLSLSPKHVERRFADLGHCEEASSGAGEARHVTRGDSVSRLQQGRGEERRWNCVSILDGVLGEYS